MKVKSDPRHHHRIKLMQTLFAQMFHHEAPRGDVDSIINDLTDIDERIKEAAPEWPINQVNKVDLAILRLAIYELKKGEVPYKVAIDEAVELAKEYGSENSPKFVNGVLGTVLKKLS